MPRETRVAYSSMEIALSPAMPTYSGGLGVLAGDTIRSCADLGMKVVAVTLLHRKGYFRQRLDGSGHQSAEPETWALEEFLEPLSPRVAIDIEDRPVEIRAWRHTMTGVDGAQVATHLLDTDLPENAPEDRQLTDSLYGGDERHRLRQEVVLGIGGVKMLRALGFHHLDRYHLNEGHAALAILALLEERHGDPPSSHPDLNALGRLLCAGSDVWLNTPIPPLEASGTSGMKAALNGVPSLSVLDGWWIEGCVEGVTGWLIGTDGADARHRQETLPDGRAAESLYEKLEGAVVPCFYQDRQRFLGIMRNAIALNGPFFNTQRMVLQYLYDAYLERPDTSPKQRGPVF